MNFIGDYFALGLVMILGLFFFDRKHTLNTASKFFIGSLIFTAATSVTDILTLHPNVVSTLPLWANILINSLYFLMNILTTSCIALYLFTRILEHSHDKHCMKNAIIGLVTCLIVFLSCILLNIKTGWMFYFDETGVYHRGPLNALGYYITVVQMGLVLICFFRNRKNATITMRRVLVQSFPVALLGIVISRANPEIMLNSFLMAMMNLVLFLTFNSQRPGIHNLTRLNDRHYFFEKMGSLMRSGEPFQVVRINIKNFGSINQKYGHMFGDELLYQFAFALEKLIKGSEAFHMNGTIFALAMPYTDQHTAEKNLSAVLNFLEDGIEYDNEHLIFLDYVTVEYIVDGTESDPKDFYEKLEYAASVAYKRKLRFVRYTPSMGDEMKRKQYLLERLKIIDREHGFQTWFQPIRCMKTGKFTSAEALIRLVEPDGSIISPAEFIPLAEQTGMLAPITWFVLEESCRLMRMHPELDFSVAINLPMAQMLDKGFIVRVNSIVDRYCISRSRIGLEFTERAILENFDQVKSVMEQCAKAGYSFYLDDFGAGYSNFNCVMNLPFQNIKLDSNLVRTDLGEKGEHNLGLTRTLVSFLHEMNLNIIVEGVECADVANVLKAQGVDRIQGYMYAKPMPESELLDFYAAH